MKDFKGMLVEGGVEGIVMNLFHAFGTVAQERGTEYIKSKLFGIGTNDEYLFWDACAYAFKEKMVTSDELMKICRVIDSFEPSQQSRIRGIIGKMETEIVPEKSVDSKKSKDGDDGDKDAKKDKDAKDDKGKKEKTTVKANLAGARMVAMLAKMSEEEIKQFFKTSGATNSFVSEVKEKAKAAAKAIADSQIKKDGDSLFPKETWLERKAREAREAKTRSII